MVFSVLEEFQGWGAERWKTLVPGCFQERKASEDGGASAVGEDRWLRVSSGDRDPKIPLVSPLFLLRF